jgi:hypothetical protein
LETDKTLVEDVLVLQILAPKESRLDLKARSVGPLLDLSKLQRKLLKSISYPELGVRVKVK